MSDREVSRTAFGTAYMRAAHQLLDSPPRILEDPAILRLLGPAAEHRIMNAPESYQTPERRALRSHVVLRARFAEDRLEAAVGRGVRQYVMLGAGFDTFALRQPGWARPLRILEVDQLGTHATKRALLAAAGLSLPDNVSLASIDLERESLRDGLVRNGLRLDEPAFFSWLGVTMYLHGAAIDAVLSFIAKLPEGSELVLTFAELLGDSSSPFEQRAAELGEPWISTFAPVTLALKLCAAGFSRVGFLMPEDAAERYFRQRPPDLPEPARTTIAYAARKDYRALERRTGRSAEAPHHAPAVARRP